MVCMAQVDRAKHSRFTQVVKQVSHVGYRENVELGLPIQASIVDTHSKLACFLTNKQYRCAIR